MKKPDANPKKPDGKTNDRMLIEINCKFRNVVGACEISGFALHCLNCPFGRDWITKHIKILKEDMKLWGKETRAFRGEKI